METLPKKRDLPKIADLYSDKEMVIKETELAILLNAEPWEGWIKEHPMNKKLKYIPIEIIEYLLTRIFGQWKVEIKESKVMANSVVVTVRLFYKNPLTNEYEWQDGIGAMPIQTKAGATAMDVENTLKDAVMKAAPAAESYAIKDAAEKLGKLFGKDLNRRDAINYESLVKVNDDRYSKLDEQ